MNHPLRIRRDGWRGKLPAGAKLVTRPSPWGNPYKIGEHGTRAEVIAMYERDLLSGELRDRKGRELRSRLPELRGRLLACYCPLNEPCHADVLARLANRPDAQVITG